MGSLSVFESVTGEEGEVFSNFVTMTPQSEITHNTMVQFPHRRVHTHMHIHVIESRVLQ